VDRPPRVVVVEDELLIRWDVSDALRELGAIVIECRTGDEAWAYLQIDPDVNVVFTDVRMPGTIDGRELASRITRGQGNVAVVVTSGHLVNADLDDTSVIFVPKPYRSTDIAALLLSLVPYRDGANDLCA
jgi:CheY-like chemotaxis protein